MVVQHLQGSILQMQAKKHAEQIRTQLRFPRENMKIYILISTTDRQTELHFTWHST